MFKIPTQNKSFKVDNFSSTRGNIWSTFNTSFDPDMGRIKLNPYMSLQYSESNDAEFFYPFAIVNAAKDSGSQLDTYILTNYGSSTGSVWSTLAGLSKITAADSPSKATDTTSDMCMFLGANDKEWIHVSDEDGLHYVDPELSASAWTLKSDASFQSKFILVPFLATNRLYMFDSTSVTSWDGTSSTATTSGSYTQVNGLSNITCARAASKRIWYATSGQVGIDISGSGKCKVYEWDGVNPNPLNIYTIDTDALLSMSILGDVPHIMDSFGRMWVYNGYEFILKDKIQTDGYDTIGTEITMHRNGMVTEKGKIYALVGSVSAFKNASERHIAGIWCYDPAIGLYHYSSPEDLSMIASPLVLSRWRDNNTFIAGYFGSPTSNSGSYRVSATTRNSNITDDNVRTGYFVTPFVESSEILNNFNTITLKYREMFDTNAKFKVKYRFHKNIEAYSTINWISTTSFTVTTSNIDGTGAFYNSPVSIGDEVMIQRGANTGLIAHITDMSTLSGTTTITIDETASVGTGTSVAMFNNFQKLGIVTSADPFEFKSFRLAKPKTMVQIKVVMSWRGYYDELQELQISNEVKQKQT